MLVLKLKRVGKKHQPSFRLIVQERRSKINGPLVEDLGSYSVSLKKADFNAERAKYWLGVGAKPTDTVYNLLVKEGMIQGKKIPVHKKPKTKTEEKPSVEAKPAEKIPAETPAA